MQRESVGVQLREEIRALKLRRSEQVSQRRTGGVAVAATLGAIAGRVTSGGNSASVIRPLFEESPRVQTILQLPHSPARYTIATPRTRRRQLRRMCARDLFQQVTRQRFDVFQPLAQRRDLKPLMR